MDVTAADDPRAGHVPGPAYLTTEELRRDVSALREILQARLDGMDRATVVLSETVNRTPTAIQTAISHLKELHDERFHSVELQFSERDVRTEQASTAAGAALSAALQAAKEAVFENSQAAAKAAEKVEQSFTKQIDQIGLRIDTVAQGFDARLTELKERIDRGEGSTTGEQHRRSEQRLDIGQVVAVVAVIVAILSVVLYALKK